MALSQGSSELTKLLVMQLCVNSGPNSQVTHNMIIGWMIQSPINVITMKYAKCFLPALSTLNVNDLLVKKLKTIATEVDMKLLSSAGRPKATRANSMKKSIAVLATPTMPNRTFSACFFMNCFKVAFLDIIKRAVLDLFEYVTDVFADYAQRQQLHAAKEKHHGHG